AQRQPQSVAAPLRSGRARIAGARRGVAFEAMVYPDREAAGRVLGTALEHLRDTDPLVLGLPRGGVPVAAAVRAVLGGDLDVLLVRELGLRWQPELARGALGEGGVVVLSRDVVDRSGVSQAAFLDVEQAELAELARRQAVLRERDPIPLAGRT